MSTNQPPRQRAVAIAAVSRLRADDALAAELYDDTTVPQADERKRVYLGNIADRRDEAAYVAVLPIATGSRSHGGGVFSRSYLTQISVVYSESFYESHGALSMYAIRDRCDDVLSSPTAPGIIPTGPEGGNSIETDADGYRTLTNRFRAQIHSRE